MEQGTDGTAQHPQAETPTTALARTRPGPDIIYRRPDFGDFDGLPKYWAGGNPGASFAQGVFSLVIPEGEKFFIRSVIALKGEVDDPELQADIKAFTRQEGSHTRAHLIFNEALRPHGYDIEGATDNTRRVFEVVEKYFSKRAALAVTVFLEHLTALGSEIEFRFPELAEGSDPRAAAFWRWHAAEELEHKAVAFDVYRAAGGSYFTRVMAVFMFMLVAMFVSFGRAGRQAKGFKRVPTDEKPVPTSALTQRHPGLRKRVGSFAIRYFLAYFRPSFHPWEVNSTRFLDAWRLEAEASPVVYS